MTESIVPYVIFIFFVLFLCIIILLKNCNQTLGNPCGETETFRANSLDSPEWDYEILGDNSATTTFFTYRNVDNYLRVAEFTEMINRIKQIITVTLIDLGKECQNMNGLEYDRLGEYQITLSCHNDVAHMEELVILAITRYIIGYVQNKFGININPYQIIGDMMQNLNLLEAVIYPLMYSTLYTVNGIQYVTESRIRETVDNLDIKNVLYTTLSKRGIVCIPDSDDEP